MFWQENSKEEHYTVPDTIQDAVFNIHSKILPIDHAYALKQALLAYLPWLDEVNAGIFDISIADGNGWQQDHESGFYYPSKRSKLVIRMPKEKLKDSESIVGKTLDLGEYQIKVVKALKPRPMSDMQIIFAKNVVCNQNTSEDAFLQEVYQQLQNMGITPTKMMAGLDRKISTPEGYIYTRSLMIADLKKAESVRLQENGIGEHRLLGCGLFMPQKGIETVDAV